MSTAAILALADGTVFQGTSIGAEGKTVGEVVFNTSMTGYQEILTDPSYAQQIVTLTYPHIGNTGVNPEDQESTQVWAAGLIIRDLPLLASNWRSEQSLEAYLKQNNIVAIADIDTRALTSLLREKGAQNACILAGNMDEEAALIAARAYPGLNNLDLAKVVSSKKSYTWKQKSWQWGKGYTDIESQDIRFHVVVYDYGVKLNILRLLVDRGCKLTVVPAQTPVKEVLALKPDGIVFSNGPGDPAACTYAIDAIREFLNHPIPLYGICLGHQLLALACGAKTIKMKFGHHGSNHPVQDLATQQVFITSQNHGFAVDETTLPKVLRVTHRSLFDGSNQGLAHSNGRAFSFQGHPEASPGPHDIGNLFDNFLQQMQASQIREPALT